MTFEQFLLYLTTLGGLVLAYLGWRRNDKGDTAEQARWMGKIDEKLDSIGKKLEKLDGVPERIGRLEEKLEQHLKEHGRE